MLYIWWAETTVVSTRREKTQYPSVLSAPPTPSGRRQTGDFGFLQRLSPPYREGLGEGDPLKTFDESRKICALCKNPPPPKKSRGQFPILQNPIESTQFYELGSYLPSRGIVQNFDNRVAARNVVIAVCYETRSYGNATAEGTYMMWNNIKSAT